MEQARQTEVKENILNVKHKILVMSNKGGVGKSTVAVNLAFGLAQRRFETGLLDIDIHGPSIPKLLNLEEMPLIGDGRKIRPVSYTAYLKVVSMGFILGDKESPVIWRGPIKMKAIQQFLEDVEWGSLDFLIIDSPPGTGDEPLSIIQLIKNLDGVVIVTTPQEVALLDSRKAVNFAKKLKAPVMGIIENMSGLICPHCDKRIDLFKTGGGEKTAAQMEVPFLGRIPLEPDIVTSGDEGRPFIRGKTDSPAFKVFEQMVEQIIESLKPKTMFERR